MPALPAEVVDTVGAGDCFAAGLTVALAEGRSLRDALAFGTAAASIAVGRVGARDLPTRAEVEALLALTQPPFSRLSVADSARSHSRSRCGGRPRRG